MKRSLLLASFLALLSWAAPRAQAASDYLLEIDGVKGESKDTAHPETIEISSFSWGMSNPALSTTGGGGAGKVSFSDLSFTTTVSKASAPLFLACATGQHIKKATLFVRKAGGDQQDYYVITLSDILVTGVQQNPGSASDTRPMESLSLNFAKIEWTYKTADGTAVSAGWDVKANVRL